ncbi:hypothetical protein BC939DRAFT_480732 [Gamsiella multidivaricata]|uniref:uncharacterized protein n=1 Tax=Gamsiella multidivaricata TaxID=101098 RepID=UPI002220D3E5|nr:uncharacterized protein BC939DRAFT_480732 [Gamsiella multidivaricata]KAI7817969.1 hypothetical protein BC939DRAFT_480732 [Gamsiella multidivaricata]
MSGGTSYIPTQRAFSGTPHHLTTKEMSTLRSTNSMSRLNADRNDSTLASSHIARPSTSTRMYPSPSPRVTSPGRLGDGTNQQHHHTRTPSSTSITGPSSGSGQASMIAKPIARTQKSSAIKPPSIVTKPSSANGHSTAATTVAQKTSNFPSVVPSSNQHPAQIPQNASSATLSVTSPVTSIGAPGSANMGKEMHMTNAPTVIVRCQCPPPLEFPEYVKREMKREEEEHRQRECGLYAKIIELQIENANLKGEKETLHRVVSHRDKMLLELQMQLQAMEFVCRENDIKVDIDMCPDEVIENWSFKESDEVYQRILLTTQDLLRNGSKCLEQNTVVGRSSREHIRATRSSTGSPSKVSLDQGSRTVEPLQFKETSRPGTLKLDMQSLMQAEQVFDGNSDRSTVNHSNLAEINASVERNGRRALDCGDDRSNLFHESAGGYHSSEDDDGDVEDDSDDDEGQESEFEQLGEDMIKYVELQSSVGPRRESRSASLSKMMTPVGTPDMSTAVLMKNFLKSGARRSAGTTPLSHPLHHQPQQSYSHGGKPADRTSSISSSSLIDDYFAAQPAMSISSTSGGIGLGLTGLGRSPERISMERFRPSAPTRPLPLTPSSSPSLGYRHSFTREHCGLPTSDGAVAPAANIPTVFLSRPHEAEAAGGVEADAWPDEQPWVRD